MLLFSLNKDSLKEICRQFEIKGYSKFGRDELIIFVMDSLSEEEKRAVIIEKEPEIIADGINTAINKIHNEEREAITNIKVINPKKHEVEFEFKGFNWKTTSFIAITPENIKNPERDCDCRIGTNMGFCNHFWIGFIFSLQQGYFKLSDWKLTSLPEDFEKRVKGIKVLPKADGEYRLIDEGSEDAILDEYINERVQIHEAELTKFEEKEQEWQGNFTTYFLNTLKDVYISPLEKKDDIRNLDELLVRISDNAHDKFNLKEGQLISCRGTVNLDSVQKIKMLKRVTSIKVLQKRSMKDKLKGKVKKPEIQEKQWEIPSSSDPSKIYQVKLNSDNTWTCTCPHYTFRKSECRHIKECKKNV